MTTAMPVACWIPGKPRPWERAARGAGGHAYTRPDDQRYRNHVRASWVSQVGRLNWTTGTVRVWMVFVGASPLADLDNLQKSILEALAWERGDGITPVWANDRQVKVIEYAASIPAPTRCDAGVWICVARDG